jgi:Ftsk gamma domain
VEQEIEPDGEMVLIEVDARMFALNMLSVLAATGKDPEQPAMFAAIQVEVYESGVRIVGMDGELVALAWVPRIDGPLPWTVAEAPSDGELTDIKFAVTDTDGLLANLCKWANTKTRNWVNDKAQRRTLRIEQVVAEPEPSRGRFLPGAGVQQIIRFTIPNETMAALPLYEGSLPSWRCFDNADLAPASVTVLASETLERLTAVASPTLWGGNGIVEQHHAGEAGSVAFRITNGREGDVPCTVRGVLMTMEQTETLREIFTIPRRPPVVQPGMFDTDETSAIDWSLRTVEGVEVDWDTDTLITQALHLTAERNGEISSTVLQRHFGLSHAEAVRLLDQMEAMGSVTAAEIPGGARTLVSPSARTSDEEPF